MQDGVFCRRCLDRICSWLFREIRPQGIRPEGARSYGPWRTVERAARRAHWPTVTFTLYFLVERWVYQRSDGWLACRTSDARGLDRMRSVTQLLSGLAGFPLSSSSRVMTCLCVFLPPSIISPFKVATWLNSVLPGSRSIPGQV